MPDICALAPCRGVLIVEAAVLPTWQAVVSEWLVRSGCLYTMAWGPGCSSWDDSVDMANIEQFDFKEIPESKFVITTWHDDQPLSEVFWFCKNNAFHPSVELRNTLLLHIAANSNEQKMLGAYAEV